MFKTGDKIIHNVTNVIFTFSHSFYSNGGIFQIIEHKDYICYTRDYKKLSENRKLKLEKINKLVK